MKNSENYIKGEEVDTPNGVGTIAEVKPCGEVVVNHGDAFFEFYHPSEIRRVRESVSDQLTEDYLKGKL